MIDIILYTTAGCHLCEQATQLLNELNVDPPINTIHTEIGDDDQLINLYGTSIPVIELPNGHQLNWPFTSADVIEKLQKN